MVPNKCTVCLKLQCPAVNNSIIKKKENTFDVCIWRPNKNGLSFLRWHCKNEIEMKVEIEIPTTGIICWGRWNSLVRWASPASLSYTCVFSVFVCLFVCLLYYCFILNHWCFVVSRILFWKVLLQWSFLLKLNTSFLQGVEEKYDKKQQQTKLYQCCRCVIFPGY